MELKLVFIVLLLLYLVVLIVPYGIETRLVCASQCSFDVLIVPYGIET